MTENEIQQAFIESVNDPELMKRIGAGRKQVYKWRHPENQSTSLAKKLEVLYLCGKISLR